MGRKYRRRYGSGQDLRNVSGVAVWPERVMGFAKLDDRRGKSLSLISVVTVFTDKP